MTADTVHVWFSRDDVSAPTVARLYQLLDGDERARADAFLRPADRRRFIVAHAAARDVVGARLGVPAARIRWRYGVNGKPSVADARAIEVNLSHSRGLCAIALSASRPVGVDVQHVSATLDVAAMARRYFSPAETRFVLAGASADARSQRFARLWARKEALVKAAGSRLLRGMPVSVLARPAGIVEFDDGLHRIADLRVLTDFRGAVALRGEAPYHVVEHWWSSP